MTARRPGTVSRQDHGLWRKAGRRTFLGARRRGSLLGRQGVTRAAWSTKGSTHDPRTQAARAAGVALRRAREAAKVAGGPPTRGHGRTTAWRRARPDHGVRPTAQLSRILDRTIASRPAWGEAMSTASRACEAARTRRTSWVAEGHVRHRVLHESRTLRTAVMVRECDGQCRVQCGSVQEAKAWMGTHRSRSGRGGGGGGGSWTFSRRPSPGGGSRLWRR